MSLLPVGKVVDKCRGKSGDRCLARAAPWCPANRHVRAERLDVSPDQIRDAVEKVGDRSSDVELHLKGSRSTTNDDRVESAP